LALCRARISIVRIAVITSFLIAPNDTITTLSHSAGRQTAIPVLIITIITRFRGLNDPITATCRLTGVAIIGGIIVPIITALARPHHAITASSQSAIT